MNYPVKLEKWREETNSKKYESRNAAIAALIDGSKSVLDLGCGNKNLKTHLNESNEYLGMDKKTGKQHLYVDFNQSDLFGDTKPDIEPFDVVVASNLLEYVGNVETVLQYIRNSVKDFAVITYFTKETRDAGGKITKAFNCFRESQILSFIWQAGFNLETTAKYDGHTLFVITPTTIPEHIEAPFPEDKKDDTQGEFDFS